jgi:hypothetical protein
LLRFIVHRARRHARIRPIPIMGGLGLPPFLNSEPMEGDPPCQWDDFLIPQLRRFPHGIEALAWQDYLGNGAEGCVSIVKFGDGVNLGPLALKVVSGFCLALNYCPANYMLTSFPTTVLPDRTAC